jgi:multicomponent Na+:H+ antiporter subunit D
VNQLPVLIPAILFTAGFLVPLVGLKSKKLASTFAAGAAGAAALVACAGLWNVLSGGTIRYRLGGWAPPVGIEYVLDPLSAFLATVITVVGFLATIYLRATIAQEMPDRLVIVHALALLLLAGLTGMVMTGDLFNLFVFLEIASLSAYGLIAIGDRQAPVAAFRYLIAGSLAGTLYVLGVAFLYFSTGSLNMADLAARLVPLYGSPPVTAGAALIALAMAIKMALFPFHSWLPDAYTYAPPGVAALIAPLMTKVAAYVLIRVFMTVFQPGFSADGLAILPVIGWLSAAAIIYGSIMAIAQNDFRRMLAYSSISQLGYVGLGIGIFHPLGLVGALLHIVNHAFMKACLFFVAGAFRLRSNAVDVAALAGFGRKMPWSSLAFTVSALSMIGIPPAGGFFSKWYLLLGAVEVGNGWFAAVILLSTLLNAVYFFRVLERIYGGGVDEDGSRAAAEAPAAMLFPALVLAGGILALGLVNSVLVTGLLQPLAAAIVR